jgi:hypothetical protein
VYFMVHKTTSELEHTILTTLYFIGAENTNKYHILSLSKIITH